MLDIIGDAIALVETIGTGTFVWRADEDSYARVTDWAEDRNGDFWLHFSDGNTVGPIMRGSPVTVAVWGDSETD